MGRFLWGWSVFGEVIVVICIGENVPMTPSKFYRISSWAVLFATLFLGGQGRSSMVEPFDPYRYVYYNEIIIEGTVLSDSELPLTEGINGNPREPGWYYPTNTACLLVDQVLLQRLGACFAVGDTICFKYATSNNSVNPDKPGLVGISSGFNGPLGYEVTDNGLFGLSLGKNGRIRKGHYFALNDSMTQQIYDVLLKLEADSTQTVEEIRRHYHGRKWEW